MSSRNVSSSSLPLSLFRPSGCRKALIIAIEYGNTPYSLARCPNDLRRMHKFLLDDLNIPKDSVAVLTDDSTFQFSGSNDGGALPTKTNIIAAVRWLLRDSEKGDSLFFYFGGHGYQLSRSAILPVDYLTNGLLLDNTLRSLVQGLRHKVRLTIVADASHSATLFDLPYYEIDPFPNFQHLASNPTTNSLKSLVPSMKFIRSISTTERSLHDIELFLGKNNNNNDSAIAPAQAEDHLQSNASSSISSSSSSWVGIKSRISSLHNKPLSSSSLSSPPSPRGVQGEVLLFAACRDYQRAGTEYDEHYNDTGAMTHAFLAVCGNLRDCHRNDNANGNGNGNRTYANVLEGMRAKLRANGYPQIVQFSTSSPFSLSNEFFL